MTWLTIRASAVGWGQHGQWPAALISAAVLTAALTWYVYDPAQMSLAVGLHLATVLPAVVTGTAMLLLRKGTALHKLLGRQWVLLMAATALVSLFIQRDGLSAIHGLSVFTLVGLVIAVRAASRNRLQHACWMVGLYIGSWVAGGFATIQPDRYLHGLLLG